MKKLSEAEIKAQHGNVLAAVAKKAITSARFTSAPGMCQRFVRQVVQEAKGSRYDVFHGVSAEQSRRAWSKTIYAVDPERGSTIGDILYKRGTEKNPFGHVGIRIAGNRVAENSTVHDGANGAKGTRS